MALVDTVVLAFSVPGLPADTFDVLDFNGEEHLSQCFRFDVNLFSPDPAVAFSDVYKKPATLSVLLGDNQMHFHGTVVHFEQGNRVGDNRYSYRVRIVPNLWLLSLSFQTRVFRDLTTQDIVTQILDANNLSAKYRFDLAYTGYKPREYCVQYEETDLDFVQRLCEHEGIYYYFVPEEGEDIVVFSDKPPAELPFIPNEAKLLYNPGGGLQAAAEAAREFIYREQVVTGKVVLKDYNYRTPAEPLKAEMQLNAEMPGVHYEFGPNFKEQAEGDHLAEVRNQEIECQRKVMTGRSGFLGLHTGHLFSLTGHFRGDFNTDYLLTDVYHSGTQAHSIPGAGAETAVKKTVYENAFQCIPSTVAYRPPRVTLVPRISGLTTALLETTGGDYAHLDEEGRYRMRMHFDLGEAAQAEATHAVRMNQPYSGPEYGIHFPNHAGMEAVLAYVNGDPDRPVALGTSPNHTQKSPSKAPNKWENVIRTWGKNELTFDDNKGAERIYMHATLDHIREVNNDETIWVGRDRKITVDRHEDIVVIKNQTANVGINRTEDVGENEKVSIGINRDVSVGVDDKLDVGSNRTATVGANDSLDVASNRSASIGSNDSLAVGSNRDASIGANDTLSVGGSLSMTVTGDFTSSANGNSGHSSSVKFSADAPEVLLDGLTKVTIQAGATLEIVCGGSSITLTPASISISSPVITAEATGIHTIKGATVAIN